MLKFVAKHKSHGPVVTVLQGEDSHELSIGRTETLLELLIKNKIEIPHSCGGMGTCGTCRIEVLQAPLAFEERNEIEAEFATERAFRDNERLACQNQPLDGLEIRIPTDQSKYQSK